jgi:hypothetical protein
MQAWFVVYMPQFVVTVHVGAVQPQPVCATHAFIIMYVWHVVAVPSQRAALPSLFGLPSAPPSSTTAHEIVAPGERQKPSPSHVKPLGQSSGPRHAEIRQSSNDAP